MNQNSSNSNTGRDPAGNIYSTPGTGPAPSGTPIVVQTDKGPVSGHLVGGYAVTDKK